MVKLSDLLAIAYSQGYHAIDLDSKIRTTSMKIETTIWHTFLFKRKRKSHV